MVPDWQNEPSESGAIAWGLSGNRDATIFLVEYDGLRDTGTLDVSASGQGNGNAPGPDVSTTQTDEVAIAMGTVHGNGVNSSGQARTSQSSTPTALRAGAQRPGFSPSGSSPPREVEAIGPKRVLAIKASVAWSGILRLKS